MAAISTAAPGSRAEAEGQPGCACRLHPTPGRHHGGMLWSYRHNRMALILIAIGLATSWASSSLGASKGESKLAGLISVAVAYLCYCAFVALGKRPANGAPRDGRR